MKKAPIATATSLLAVLLLAGCAGEAGSDGEAARSAIPVQADQELPAGHPPVPPATPPGHPPVAPPTPSGIVPPPPGSGSGAAALTWTKPEAWQEETPSSQMRRAQYRVPGPGGDAECVVFYFGPGQGGDPRSNVLRWADQFGQPDGGPSRDVLVTEELVVAGIPVLTAEVKGTYSGGMTGMEPQAPRPESMLLGAVAEGPDASWFFKLTGPEETVEESREQFMSLVRSLRPGES